MANSIEEVNNTFDTSNDIVKDDVLSYNDIAAKLLNERLLLTALELHAELCEVGKELPILRDYFSNPGNFETQNIKPEPYIAMPRSLSQATLDSLDMTRYSEDGGGIDERVAILEFELRKARENISALRANLTCATESDSTPLESGFVKHVSTDSPIKPHEQRALNYLVNEYLLTHSYKLTSITFSDENENQDFEDWDDVGLNISKPAELLQIYREFMRASGHDKPPSTAVGIQTEFIQDDLSAEKENEKKELKEMMSEIKQLKEQRTILEQEKSELERILAGETNLVRGEAKGSTGTIQTINSNSSTPEKFEILESMNQDISVIQEPSGDDSTSVVTSLNETDPGDREWTTLQFPRPDVTAQPTDRGDSSYRLLPPNFEREVMSHCVLDTSSPSASFIEDPLKECVTQESLVEILSYSLPRIIPNVILNKREEMIPLILSAVQLNSNPREREKLLQLLFNMKKRPQEDERLMILAGLAAMARGTSTGSIEIGEVLGQCWEQSQHKHLERRLLVAECCSVLALHVCSTTRNSLMLSMLQQMLLEDKEPVVRSAVVKSLSLLVALMDDPDKYFQCEELTLTALDDSSSTVVETASKILIPVMAQWALSLKRLQSHLLPRLLSKLKNQLKKSSHQNIQNKDRSEGDRAAALIDVLQYLLPHIIVCVADNDIVRSLIQDEKSLELAAEFDALCLFPMINPKVFYEGKIQVAVLLNKFFDNTWENDTWPELEWLTDKLLPDIIDMVKSVNVTQDVILNSFMTYVHCLCSGFGRHVTLLKIQPIFASEVSELERRLITLSPDRGTLSLTLIPVYLTLISTLDHDQVSKSLNQFIVAFSISGVSNSALQMAVVRLCGNNRLQEQVLGALWEGVVHQRSSVRSATAILFSVIISQISDQLANTRVAPALVTLASDSDITVKASAIPALARLVTECGAQEARDKARLTLETIAREPQGVPSSLAVPLVAALSTIAPNCPQNYTEDVIATQLAGITASALHQGRKIELANSLVEAYSVLVYCPLSNQCVTGVLLPGLRYLEALVNQILPQHRDLVNSLLREAESRQDSPKQIERSSSTSSGLSLTMANVNVGQGVEDMRQRMSKIFQQKTNAPSMANIFRKK